MSRETRGQGRLSEFSAIRQMSLLVQFYPVVRFATHLPTAMVRVFSALVGLATFLPINAHVLLGRIQRRRSEYAQRVGAIIETFGIRRGREDVRGLLEELRRYFGFWYTADLFLLFMKLEDRSLGTRVRGLQQFIEDATTTGPAILAMPNLGSCPLLPPLLAANQLPVSMIVLDSEASGLAEALHTYYPATDAAIDKLALEDKTSLIRAAARLRQGGRLCMYPEFFPLDGSPSMATIPFMDSWIRVPVGCAALAARLKVPVIPVALISRRGGRFEVVRSDPVWCDGDTDQNIEEATQRVFQGMETLVRRFPEQWQGWYLFANFPQHGPFTDPQPAQVLSA